MSPEYSLCPKSAVYFSENSCLKSTVYRNYQEQEFMFDLGKNGDILARFIYIIEEVSLTTASSLLSKVEEVFQTRNVNMNIYML